MIYLINSLASERGVSWRKKVKRKMSNLVIAVGLVSMVVVSVLYLAHRVPEGAPFETSTACVSDRAIPVNSPLPRPYTMVVNRGMDDEHKETYHTATGYITQYTLLVGTFGWQRQVRPKFGYIIVDRERTVDPGEVLTMERGRRYNVYCAVKVAGSDSYLFSSHRPVVTILAI